MIEPTDSQRANLDYGDDQPQREVAPGPDSWVDTLAGLAIFGCTFVCLAVAVMCGLALLASFFR